MVESNPNTHVDEKQDCETADRLEVSGKEGVGHGAEAEEEQNSGRGPNRPFVEDGDVDAFDFFAKVEALLLGARQILSIPQGVYRQQARVTRRIR